MVSTLVVAAELGASVQLSSYSDQSTPIYAFSPLEFSSVHTPPFVGVKSADPAIASGLDWTPLTAAEVIHDLIEGGA